MWYIMVRKPIKIIMGNMKIKVTAIKFETVDGKKIGKSFSFNADVNDYAKCQTPSDVKKRVQNAILEGRVFTKDDHDKLKIDTKALMDEWRKMRKEQEDAGEEKHVSKEVADAGKNVMDVESSELSFYKLDGRWYVDLPDWKGDFDDLEMVNGADTLLEILSARINRRSINFEIWTSNPGIPCAKLTKTEQTLEGATYQVENCLYYNDTVWLCNVTKSVFGGSHPNDIYFRVINAE